MKRIFYTLSVLVVLGLSVNTSAAAERKPSELTEQQAVQIEQIKRRVEEIKAMDKSDLTREERKALRSEVKDMKKQANAIANGGVYLSVGAIIIILLVLILLL
jgi:CHASE3 domain sensor protein